jgi:hypothetical protein
MPEPPPSPRSLDGVTTFPLIATAVGTYAIFPRRDR